MASIFFLTRKTLGFGPSVLNHIVSFSRKFGSFFDFPDESIMNIDDVKCAINHALTPNYLTDYLTPDSCDDLRLKIYKNEDSR